MPAVKEGYACGLTKGWMVAMIAIIRGSNPMPLYVRAGFEFRTTPDTMVFRRTRQSLQRKITFLIVMALALGVTAVSLLLVMATSTGPLCAGVLSLVMAYAARDLALHGRDPFLLDRVADRFQHGEKELAPLSSVAAIRIDRPSESRSRRIRVIKQDGGHLPFSLLFRATGDAYLVAHEMADFLAVPVIAEQEDT